MSPGVQPLRLGLAFCLAVVLTSSPAAAQSGTITGKLSQSGLTVVALDAAGRTSTAVPSADGAFTLVPKAAIAGESGTVTLHLRAANGTYAGPVVIADDPTRIPAARAAVRAAAKRVKRTERRVTAARRKMARARGRSRARARRTLKRARSRLRSERRKLAVARRTFAAAERETAARATSAVVGVRPGAALGDVVVNAVGYAVARGLRQQQYADLGRRAQAVDGVPIGTGNFGRVASTRSDGAMAGDRDVDGLPDPLDVDDDGDLLLDWVDRTTAPRAAQGEPPTFSLLPQLSLPLAETANANHPALVVAIQTALQAKGMLVFGSGFPSGACPVGATVCAASAEIDCAGDPSADPPRPALVYCSRGGTGTLQATGEHFPECCDADNDGFGTMPPFTGTGQLRHGATTDQIKTGDVLIERGTDRDGVEIGAITTLLPFVFASVPALVSYDDDGPTGEPPVEISYPYAGGPLLVDPRPQGDPDAGDIVLTLRFWRPQRSPIGSGDHREACLDNPQPCQWIDIGGLGYVAGLGAGECGPAAFSEDDANLTAVGPLPFGAASVFADTRADAPADPGQTLSYTFNVTRCLEEQGSASSFDEAGEVRSLLLIAAGGGRADQGMELKRR